MSISKICVIFVFSITPLVTMASEKNGFYVVAEAGTTEMKAPTTTTISITSNSYNFGAGYEADSLSGEFTYGSGFNLSSTYGSSTSTFELSNWTVVLNYKILNLGNFRPFLGVGRYGGTVTTTSGSGGDYSRNMWNVGVEVPLDSTTSIRGKYLKTFDVSGYTGFTNYSLGLLYRF
jgi:hypothetical protein